MPKKFTVTIHSHEDNTTETVDLEGMVLLGIEERGEEEDVTVQRLQTIKTEEIASLMDDLEEDFPSVRMARIMTIQEKLKEGTFFPTLEEVKADAKKYCDCPKCVARRAEESNMTPNQ